MPKHDKTRSLLIRAGVKNLREFGYPDVTEDNILTDAVYSVFFDSMLKENLGKGFDTQIAALRSEINPAS